MNTNRRGIFLKPRSVELPQKSSKSKWPAVAVPIFFVLSVLYLEIVLHLSVGSRSDWYSYGYIILFSVSFGFIFSLLSLSKFGHVITIVLLSLLTLFFSLQFFLFRSFQSFMNLQSIQTGAGDIAGDFGLQVVSLVLKGSWMILVLAVPLIGYLLLHRKFFQQPPQKGLAAICYILAFGVFFMAGRLGMQLHKVDQAKYKQQFHYDTACQTFGLLTGSRLDIQYMLFGNDSETTVEAVAVPKEPGESASTSLPAASGSGTTQYGTNQMDLDFEALQSTITNHKVLEMNAYISALDASSQNAYTGLFKGKNLILITAEAFSDEVIDQERTPTLYRMAHEGIDFTDYYQPAWGGSTSTGEFSNLTGLIPTDGVSSIQDTIDHNMYFTLGNQLQRQGYFSAAYHDGSYTYYNRNNTHCNLGYTTFTAMGNGMEAGVSDQWPESDLEMLRFTLQEYIDRQPFSIYYMTVSGHGGYQKTANKMAQKNWDTVADIDASEVIQGYYAANLELEYAMEYLIDALTKAGIAEDTVIVLSTDHYPYGLEKSDTWNTTKDYLPELYGYEADSNPARDHSRLIIWSACLEGKGLQVDSPTYSLDIVPTLSNLFGLDYDSRLLVGRDVFSDQNPLVIWSDYSWKTNKGYYDATSDTFTPDDGTQVDEDYIAAMKTNVKNKFALSTVVLQYDYYGQLFGKDDAD